MISEYIPKASDLQQPNMYPVVSSLLYDSSTGKYQQAEIVHQLLAPGVLHGFVLTVYFKLHELCNVKL